MTIHLLPPQLANQIAAGEVVERPASVVKELVENSVDAGATIIEIHIEKGGTKCIRVRDNGAGIAQDELVLALMRHATSKIHTIDDLNAIMTLGFRGEALASISAVSRLTLTTKTETQSQARQAYAEGRNMDVSIKPAAHPTGTTVEVLDLFYNTPARRKFLRSDKTEFMHIDEIVRKIALVRHDVTFSLYHNQKLIRQYRATNDEHQRARLLAICGDSFAQSALRVTWSHDDLELTGWIPTQQSDAELFQYFFINGRVVKDRLLSHAIRQAYQIAFGQELQPSFVLYLQIDPEKIDVNVHPTKQEVRFYQTRLVHDFLYHAILMTLQQHQAQTTTHASPLMAITIPENRPAAGANTLKKMPPAASAILPQPLEKPHKPPEMMTKPVKIQEPHHQYREKERPTSAATLTLFPEQHAMHKEMDALFLQSGAYSFGRVLCVVEASYALVEQQSTLNLLSLTYAQTMLFQHQLANQTEDSRQPLIIPISVPASSQETRASHHHQDLLLGINLELIVTSTKVALNGVPLTLRKVNWHQVLPFLLNYLQQHAALTQDSLIQFLCTQTAQSQTIWTQGQAIQLIAELERTLPDSVISPPKALLHPIDFNSAIVALHDNNTH